MRALTARFELLATDHKETATFSGEGSEWRSRSSRTLPAEGVKKWKYKPYLAEWGAG